MSSRWTLEGSYRRRAVKLSGIAIDRFEGEMIVEAWGATIELVRQLGAWRTAAMCVSQWRLLVELARS